MSGGGIIIIDDALKSVLSNPLIHGILPPKTKAIVDPILAKETSDWTREESQAALRAFTWAHTNV